MEFRSMESEYFYLRPVTHPEFGAGVILDSGKGIMGVYKHMVRWQRDSSISWIFVSGMDGDAYTNQGGRMNG